MQYESERIEYKSQMVDDIYKKVIAFANTNGGVIYIGIDDNGKRQTMNLTLNETPLFYER
ncbi:AlbA family DNA-binding domain-containing protein, partial [Blautia sp.]|uniref:AlbA family DNA-binding domain-containing protein n=1 Tax=Blautia sp. TaxID=1955243 RepID=UPI0025807B49